MGKIWIEICLISARGLQRTSSLFKLQWYAVGWIDSKNKYCTRVDACGNTNPVWKTKFSTIVDDLETNSENLVLQVEVYSRDPIFLRERLQGTATVVLKEFLDKFVKSSEGYKTVEEVGSFQLRKRNSNKPQGFVDVSIRVSEEKEEHNIYTGDNEGIKLFDYNNNPKYPSMNQYAPSHTSQSQFPPPPTNPTYLPTYPNSSQSGPSYTRGPAYPPPPPPPPPYNTVTGYNPNIFQRPDNYHNLATTSYMSVPYGGAGRGSGAGFGMGLGAGALAGGAVIFGDDFMSGFSVPSGLHNPSLTIATDPTF